MPVTNPSAIVDAIMTDLTTNSGLTPNTQWKYAAPRVFPPEACPLLAVWCEHTDYELLTGSANLEAYERRHTIQIGWYDALPSLAIDTGGVGDPNEVLALDAIAEQLIARATIWTAGIPGFDSQVVATIRTKRLDPQSGALWRALITLNAEEAS